MAVVQDSHLLVVVVLVHYSLEVVVADIERMVQLVVHYYIAP